MPFPIFILVTRRWLFPRFSCRPAVLLLPPQMLPLPTALCKPLEERKGSLQQPKGQSFRSSRSESIRQGFPDPFRSSGCRELSHGFGSWPIRKGNLLRAAGLCFSNLLQGAGDVPESTDCLFICGPNRPKHCDPP